MKAFNVEGDFQMGRIRQHFAVQMVGETEADARERALTDLGSRHGVARREVNIESVTAVADDAMDDITRHRIGS